MAWVNRQVAAIGRNAQNAEGGYSARSIDDVLDVMHPLLAEAGLTVPFEVISGDYAVVLVGKNQNPFREATLLVEFRFTAPDGSYIATRSRGEALDSFDKATNKALIGALKYALLGTFTIPVSAPDTDLEHGERSSAATAPTVEWRDAELVEVRGIYDNLPQRLADEVMARVAKRAGVDHIEEPEDIPPINAEYAVGAFRAALNVADDPKWDDDYQDEFEVGDSDPGAGPIDGDPPSD